MSHDKNIRPLRGKAERLKNRHSDTSVRLNLRVEPEERDSLKKLQELLRVYTGGRRISASILLRRMMNVYTASIMDLTLPVDQQIEAGHLKASDREKALLKAMKPEVDAVLRTSGYNPKLVK